MELAQQCYEITAGFPKREIYGLASQVRRAAVSIASNIAEGHSRRSRQAYLNHLSIALGSQSEVETQIDLSCRLGFISKQAAEEILLMAGQVGRMLHALITSLERKGD
jgi:four helix bundle protein